MNCTNTDCKHVSYKDLQNYFRKDKYFGDLSDEEKDLIKQNLGITSENITLDLHKNIWKKAQNNLLTANAVYIITDFRTIYKCNNQILGDSDSAYPSEMYCLILRATGSSTFDPRVLIYSQANSDTEYLELEYDITPKEISDGTYNLGTITYMKDARNNVSASYDYKNIHWYRATEEEQYPKTFMSSATNIRVWGTDNVFYEGVQDCDFPSNFEHNTIKCALKNCSGELQKATVANFKELSNCTFIKLNDKNKYIYLDADTETFQIENI